jgi:hypothetical protein
MKEILEQDRIRLTNQLWKLIPMWENGEDWESHLDSVITEIMGLIKLFSLNDVVLISKLYGLKENKNITFLTYRRTVFKSIELLGRVLGCYE